MLALATTQEGDVPLFLRPLDGNSSDKVTLASAVEALHEQLQAPENDPSFFVADSGISSEANMRRFNEAKIPWISRVPETSKEAKAVVETATESAEWHDSADGQSHWVTQTMSLPQGRERWVVVRTEQGEARAQATLKRQVEKAEHSWKQKLWHLSNQHFACQADAEAALKRELKGLPVWLDVQSEFVSAEHHAGRGRPRKDAAPTMQWHIASTVAVKQPQVEQEARRKACFIVATNAVETAVLSHQEVVTLYKEQGSVERGFRFLRVSVVPGLFRLRQKAGAHRRAWLHYGAVFIGLPISRTSAAHPFSRNRADHSRSAQPTHEPSHHAMGLSMF
jgi:transposase